jgi:cell division protein FtsQ
VIGWQAIRNRRFWIAVAIACGFLATVAAPWWAPALLSRMAFFRLRHVQVTGVRYLDPAQVVKLMDVDTLMSVWDDKDVLAKRISVHPQVREVRISRKLPGTLVVFVQEEPPIAFVPSPAGLRALDAAGDTLPIDPVRVSVDLPIIAKSDSGLLELLSDLRVSSPALYRRISEVRKEDGDELLIEMPPIVVRAMADLSSARLADILPVERDLARRTARVLELDLRYRGQVVARVK